jgi:hypothetical protein
VTKDRMNNVIKFKNNENRFSLGKLKRFTTSDFIFGMDFMIGGGAVDVNRCMLWSSERKQREKVFRKSILKVAYFEVCGMLYWRFEQFCKFSPAMWENKDTKGSDDWRQGINMTDEFNERCKKVISASRENTADESMCTLRPHTTKLGGWSHLLYMFCKPEPIGTEFKNTCCTKTGVLMMLEIQRATEHTPNHQYNRKKDATMGICLHLAEAPAPRME